MPSDVRKGFAFPADFLYPSGRLRLHRFEAEPQRERVAPYGKPEAFRTSDGIAEEIAACKLNAVPGSEWFRLSDPL
jgi:hypothetical protein